jgi:hypothetical protein
MAENLIQLAERYVRLSGELDATRDAMKRVLMNGGGESLPVRPSSPAARRAAGQRHPKAIAAAKIDEKIIGLLKDRPGMKVGDLARATDSKTSTTSERLRRMRERGFVAPADGGGWSVSAPPA